MIPADDQPEVYREKMRTARKPHTCCECQRQIAPGEKYQDVWGVWSGERKSFATCESCAELRERVRDALDYPEDLAFGDAREGAHELGLMTDAEFRGLEA